MFTALAANSKSGGCSAPPARNLIGSRPASWSVEEVEELVEAMRDQKSCSALQVTDPGSTN